MVPRGRTPLPNIAPSLAASNQSQIDDLVQRNRTLEYTVKKVTDELNNENNRSKGAIIEIQKQWQVEQSEWRRGYDTLQSCHRIVQLRNVIDVEKERMNVLKEWDILRMEKLKRLQRDFRITMFQARETELEERILGLEEDREALVVELEETIRRLNGKHSEFLAQVQAKEDEHVNADKMREEFEEKLITLREDKAHLQSSVELLNSKLERTKLQLEGSQMKCVDLERTCNEFKRTNDDVHRQLEKWQNLETKDGAEVETQRKKRMELEIQNVELQSQLEKTKEEKEINAAKEKLRVEKLKERVLEWQAKSEKHEKESNGAMKDLAKAQKQLIKLKSELNIERARVHPSPEVESQKYEQEIEDLRTQLAKGQEQINELKAELEDNSARIRPPSPENKQVSPLLDVDDGEDLLPSTPSAVRPKSSRVKPTSNLRNGNTEAGPSRPKRGNTEITLLSKQTLSDIEELPRTRTKAMVATALNAEPLDSDIEEVGKKGKPKGKAKAKVVKEPDGDPEVQAVVDQTRTQGRGVKRKAARGDPDVVLFENSAVPIKRKDKGLKDAKGKVKESNTKSGTEKGTKLAGSVNIQQRSGTRDEEAGQDDADRTPVPKKKRKINIFPPSELTAFNFLPTIDDGLNIPTVLSPIKQTEIPSRSISGSAIGSIGSMLRNSFAPRRR